MAVHYPGHWLITLRQAVWQDVVLLLVLLPLAALRTTTQPPVVRVGLILLTLAPFVLAYQAARFLAAQERLHDEPTPSMVFVFRLVVNTPLTLGGMLFGVLVSLE